MENDLMTKGYWKGDVLFYHKDGSSFYAANYASPIVNDKGEVECVSFIAKDISIRKRLEEELIQSNNELESKVLIRTAALEKTEKMYRDTFESNPMPMWVIDNETFQFLDVNELAVLEYGYSKQEFLSMTALDIRPEKDKINFLEFDRKGYDSEEQYNKGNWRHRKKNGAIIDVEIVAHPIIFKGLKCKLVLSNNITQRIITQKQLAASEKRFRALIENSHEAISIMDKSFNPDYALAKIHYFSYFISNA